MSPRTTFRVTVCQLRSDNHALEEDWKRLVTHVRETGSDFVLLPEMPFFPWPFGQEQFESHIWEEALTAHDRWQQRIGELSPATVAGSRPVTENGHRLNRAFIKDAASESTIRLGRSKYYLPDEEGFWEGSWYQAGDGEFDVDSLPLEEDTQACVGFLICTEMWFMEKARRYGKLGAELLLTPRATERRTVDRWLAGGRAAAVIAGAYSLSSNHYREGNGPASLGGFGWVVGPDGDVLALTTPSKPFVTVTVDLQQARAAKKTYPRYVRG